MTNKFREINVKNLAIITLVILIAYSILFINNSSYFNNFDKDCFKNAKISGKILINGNTGWTTAKNAGTCSGSGTYSDPYIIEDLEIDGGGSGNCIWIQNSQLYFKIINCTISNAGENWGDGGIKLTSIANGHLINNTIISCYEGIILDSSHHIVISGNTVYSNDYVGIGLWYSQNNIIQENTFRLNGWGISLESSDYNNITENISQNNKDDGIGIWNSASNFIMRNDVKDNNHHGLYLYNSERNDILGNIIKRSYWGLYLETGNDNFISDNDVSDNYQRGLVLYYSDGNEVSRNTINNNHLGIVLDESDSNSIDENTISNNYVGIDIYQSKCNIILNNTFSSNSHDTNGAQNACIPVIDPIDPILIRNVLLLIMIIIPIILFGAMSRIKKIPPPPKDILVENLREKFQRPETPSKGPKPETKSELLIKPKIEKLKDAKLSTPDEVSLEEEILLEKQVVKKIPEEKPEEILSPEPQISHCPFCGLEIIEDASYCPQCGRAFKKR
ncbi:MAG: NosD domain-containing protein [Promethearchaeota archaeon]